MNKIIIIGTVTKACEFSHERYGIIFNKTVVSCQRSSGSRDEITVITPQSNNYICGDRVVVEGHIQTENYEDAEGKHLKVYVYSDKIDETNYNSDMNEGHIIGRICKKKPLRKTPTGRTIVDFVLAVDGIAGRTYYIPVIAWGATAEFVNNLSMGTKIECAGRLQSRTYTKGKTIKSILEFSLNEFNVALNDD